jgi:hypothetical protein
MLPEILKQACLRKHDICAFGGADIRKAVSDVDKNFIADGRFPQVTLFTICALRAAFIEMGEIENQAVFFKTQPVRIHLDTFYAVVFQDVSDNKRRTVADNGGKDSAAL